MSVHDRCSHRVVFTAIVVIVGTLFGTVADAALVIAPQSVVSNTMGGLLSNPATRMFNQGGLSTGYTNGVTDFATYLAGNPTHDSRVLQNNYWLSGALNTSGNIVFDLGATYRIDQIALWDLGKNNPADISSMTLRISDTTNFAMSDLLGTIALGDPNGGAPNRPHQLFGVTPGSGRYLRFSINGPSGIATNVGLGEFILSGTPVPEASGTAMVVVALLMICLMRICRFDWRPTVDLSLVEPMLPAGR